MDEFRYPCMFSGVGRPPSQKRMCGSNRIRTSCCIASGLLSELQLKQGIGRKVLCVVKNIESLFCGIVELDVPAMYYAAVKWLSKPKKKISVLESTKIYNLIEKNGVVVDYQPFTPLRSKDFIKEKKYGVIEDTDMCYIWILGMADSEEGIAKKLEKSDPDRIRNPTRLSMGPDKIPMKTLQKSREKRSAISTKKKDTSTKEKLRREEMLDILEYAGERQTSAKEKAFPTEADDVIGEVSAKPADESVRGAAECVKCKELEAKINALMAENLTLRQQRQSAEMKTILDEISKIPDVLQSSGSGSLATGCPLTTLEGIPLPEEISDKEGFMHVGGGIFFKLSMVSTIGSSSFNFNKRLLKVCKELFPDDLEKRYLSADPGKSSNSSKPITDENITAMTRILCAMHWPSADVKNSIVETKVRSGVRRLTSLYRDEVKFYALPAEKQKKIREEKARKVRERREKKKEAEKRKMDKKKSKEKGKSTGEEDDRNMDISDNASDYGMESDYDLQ